jgi:hypothetical protein
VKSFFENLVRGLADPHTMAHPTSGASSNRYRPTPLGGTSSPARWRYQLIVTNIHDLGRRVTGSHHVYFLDTLHRQHAVVEDRVRTEKATGIRNLPCHGYERNKARLQAANIASDLLAHLQLLGLEPESELAAAEPESLRATILHIPARLTTHARRRVLRIEKTWPWATALLDAWERLGRIPAPA